MNLSYYLGIEEMEELPFSKRICVFHQTPSFKVPKYLNEVKSTANELGKFHAKLYLFIEAQVRED